ncbi:MAG: hypothetical protein M1831_007256 [Alyxoria varia]|nr:MAG: hypothetical protein M1831_007256 [Alyxoria varia]
MVNILLAILISLAVASGTGKPIATIDPAELPYAIKINTIANAVSIVTFTLPKIAIALLLIRILSLNKITVAFFIGLAVFLNIYGCVQIASFLVFAVKRPSITVNTALGEGALSAFADLFYGAYPVWVIMNLQMAARRKIAISIMFALGIVSCVVACYKCTKLNVLKDRHVDLTYSSAPLMYWTSIEANVVTIAACVPTLGPIFALVWKPIDGYFSGSNYQYRGHQSYQQFPHEKRTPNVQSKSIDNIELVGPKSQGSDDPFGPTSQARKSSRIGNAIGINAHDIPESDEESLTSGGRNSGVAAEPQSHVATGNAPDAITKRVEFSVSEEYSNNTSQQNPGPGGPSTQHRHGNSTHAPNFSAPGGRRVGAGAGNVADDDGTQQRLYQSYGMAKPSEVV